MIQATRRREALSTALGAALGLATGGLPRIGMASPDAYPSRTVKLINAFPPGGPADVLARAIAATLQERTKQAFIVESKAGAGGNIGAEAVARSAPDGYTVLIGIDSTFTVNPHIYRSMPFKPTDLKPVVSLVTAGLMMAVSTASGIRSVNDLLAAGRSRGLSFSSAGAGSPGHLAAEVFSDLTGIRINHVPYKGNAPAVLAVVSGEVDGGILAAPGLLPHVQSNRVTGLAVTSSRRSSLVPDLPTVTEIGMKGLTHEVLHLAMVPAATPAPIVDWLARAMMEALARPEMQARLASLDMFIDGQTGAELARKLADASQRYERIVRATRMSVD